MPALFGGSFDPVHLGHLAAAEAAADQLAMPVRFLPAREQPFKRGGHTARPEQRAEMLELAVAGNPRLGVERIELELSAPSYTVRTLRALAERDPDTRYTLLLGADAAADVPAWHEAQALPELADLVVFARAGAPLPPGSAALRRIDVPAIDVSATRVRALVAEGRSIRYLVPDTVREYIAAHGLYR